MVPIGSVFLLTEFMFEIKYKSTKTFATTFRARVDGKLDRILNRKIARKSLGQPRVYATTCDESGIILAYFLLLFTIYVMIFVRFPVQMSQKSSCTWALRARVDGKIRPDSKLKNRTKIIGNPEFMKQHAMNLGLFLHIACYCLWSM